MASNQTTLTMSDLINEVLDDVYRPVERPRQVLLTVAASDTGGSVTITVDAVAAASLAQTDVLEFDRELMVVTAVSGQTITVTRGYQATTVAAHVINSLGQINPLYPRHKVDRDIRRCFQSLVTDLPRIFSETLTPASSNGSIALLPLDEECMEVIKVRFMESQTSRVVKLQGRWRFEDDLPTDISLTGKALMVPYGYRDKNLIVTYQLNYTWAGTGESATIRITIGGENLPVLFAIAKLRTGLEISRQEFDGQVEEWPALENSRRGSDVRLLQTLWGRYFQRLEEVVSTRNIPRHRPYDRVASRL